MTRLKFVYRVATPGDVRERKNTMATTTRTSPRRRAAYLNRLEDKAPGRVAFVVYKTRGQTSQRSRRAYQLLSEWSERRQKLLDAENGGGHDAGSRSSEADDEFGNAGEGSTDAGPTDARSDHEESTIADSSVDTDGPSPDAERPSDDWTKGRLYELARTYELSGRSKLNKADLLDAVLEEWDERNSD